MRRSGFKSSKKMQGDMHKPPFHVMFVWSLLLGVVSVAALLDHPPPADPVCPVKAPVMNCSHPEAVAVMRQSVLLGQFSTRGRSECLSQCYRQVACHVAVRAHNISTSKGTCFLLRSTVWWNLSLPLVLQSWLNASSATTTCSLLLMNPCLNGGSFSRGFCSCPAGYTGLHCHLHNPAECVAPWKRVYSTDNLGRPTFGSALDVINLMSSTTHHDYLRIVVQGARNATSQLLMQASTFSRTSSGRMAGQLMSVLSQTQVWNRLDKRPWMEFYAVLWNGTVFGYNEQDLEPPTERVLGTDWFLRDTQTSNLLYKSNSSGYDLFGQLNDVLLSVARGEAIHDCNTVALPPGTPFLQEYMEQLGWSTQTYQLLRPLYYLNSKLNVRIRLLQHHRTRLDGSGTFNTNQTTVGVSVYADTCWTKAYTDRMGFKPSRYPLVACILSGQRLRLGVDGVLWLTVLQALVRSDSNILVDTAPYLNPENSGPLNNASQENRIVASSNGTLWNCTGLPNGFDPPFAALTRQAVFLVPFANTRPWRRVFSVAGDGTPLHGSESALVSAVTSGAPAQVGLGVRPAFPSAAGEGDYLLLVLTSLEVTAEGHVTGQASDLLRLEKPGSCGRRAFLVTSLGDVRVYDYSPHAQGLHSDVNVTIMDWFVEGYSL